MLATGGRAPEFTLPDQDGQSVSLSALLDLGTLILYFYPADFTPGCTREACFIRDLHAEIQEAGARLARGAPLARRAGRPSGARGEEGQPRFGRPGGEPRCVLGVPREG